MRLKDKIIVVTGATRGAGRGISKALAKEGATIYVTGRSTRGGTQTSDFEDATIERTAEEVNALGGVGIPVRVDHTVEEDVKALFERVQQEQGRLDVLVNNAWGGYEGIFDVDFSLPFWEQPLWRWDKMFNAGVRSHYLSSRYAAPLMLPHKHGLIVNTTVLDKEDWLSNIAYDLSKTTINRMAHRMSRELREHNIAAVALALGWIRSEEMIKRMYPDVDDFNYRDHPELHVTESVQYAGRAIAALATDASVMDKSGRTMTTGELARLYGFNDLDGTQPDWYTAMAEQAAQKAAQPQN
jgi:NAD(P)-dependent dehydrogenase (short-subunit alcohol dehydrogenase family)